MPTLEIFKYEDRTSCNISLGLFIMTCDITHCINYQLRNKFVILRNLTKDVPAVTDAKVRSSLLRALPRLCGLRPPRV